MAFEYISCTLRGSTILSLNYGYSPESTLDFLPLLSGVRQSRIASWMAVEIATSAVVSSQRQ